MQQEDAAALPAAGRARSAMNALRHGLRAKKFVLLPHEDAAEFRAFALAIQDAVGPTDPYEHELVQSMAVAMWREQRADRVEAEAMADIAPAEPGRSCGSDFSTTDSRASLATVLRYRSQAQHELRRAHNLLERHRRLRAQSAELWRQSGGEPAPANKNCTNEPEEPAAQPRAEPRAEARRRLERQASDQAKEMETAAMLARLDLVRPVPGLAPALWPAFQRNATPGPYPPDGPQPYRPVPGAPSTEWHRLQHRLRDPPTPRPAETRPGAGRG